VQIHQLEETLGVPLFDRTTRTVTMTHEGKRLAAAARLLTQEISLVASEFRDEANIRRGIATLATIPSETWSLIPAVIASISDKHPGVNVHIIVREDSAAVAKAVHQGEADMGLSTWCPAYDDLAYAALFEEELVALIPATHRLFHNVERMPLTALAGIPLLLQPVGTSIRTEIDLQLARQQVAVTIRLELLHVGGLVALVRAGLGMSILPDRALDPFDLHGCRIIPLTGMKPRSIGLLTPAGTSTSHAASTLKEFILSEALAMP